MIRKASPCLSILSAMALLLVAVPLPSVEAGVEADPKVNGIIYGDGDIDKYEIWGYAYPDPNDPPPYCAAGDPVVTLYGKVGGETGTTLYVAVVESRCINDNVIGQNLPVSDQDYLESASWIKENGTKQNHTLFDLYDSDMLEFQLQCAGDESGGFIWQQGYLYDADEDWDPREADWRSDNGDTLDEPGTPPPGIVSSSSMAWNMNNKLWDVTLLDARTCSALGGSANCTWKSPDTGIIGDVTDEAGYPDAGPITYDSTNSWEWPIVYEWRVDLADYCPNMQFETFIISSHNSPTKGGGEDPNPLSVYLLYFAAEGAKKSVVLSWATRDEVDNLGFNLWRANSLDGEKVRINDELIPSQVSPAGGGAVYEYVDTKLKNNTAYYYWLQDVDIYGNVGWSDPVEATTTKPGRNARR
jgi:hypothetical protein